jgi:hypothetical protein
MKNKHDILICAFRYAIGRCTYTPSIVAETITDEWPDLSKENRRLIQSEIRYAIERNRAGMDCDVEIWEEILDLEV